ncbi:hypothetical protein MRX96_049104 [Rhipicephalus microplus]
MLSLLSRKIIAQQGSRRPVHAEPPTAFTDPLASVGLQAPFARRRANVIIASEVCTALVKARSRWALLALTAPPESFSGGDAGFRDTRSRRYEAVVQAQRRRSAEPPRQSSDANGGEYKDAQVHFAGRSALFRVSVAVGACTV